MKVNPVLDRDLNKHYLNNSKAHRAWRIAKRIDNSKLITQNSQLSISQLLSDHLENLMKHRPCEFAGLSVLLAGMVGGN